MIRRHYVHEVACYVVQRADGTPLSFPVWMTEPEAALVDIIDRPRLPLTALLELRRLTVNCLSSMDSSKPEGEHDAGPLDATKEPIRRRCQSPATPEVQQTVTRLLVQWLQALVEAIEAEVDDEQDQR